MYENENTIDVEVIPAGADWIEVGGSRRSDIDIDNLYVCHALHVHVRKERPTPPGTVVIERHLDGTEGRAWHREAIARADRRWFCFCLGDGDHVPYLPPETNVAVNMIDDQVGQLFDEPGTTPGRRPAEDYVAMSFRRLPNGEFRPHRGAVITTEYVGGGPR